MMMSTPLLLCRAAWSVFGSADDQLMPISFSFAQNVEISSICAHCVYVCESGCNGNGVVWCGAILRQPSKTAVTHA